MPTGYAGPDDFTSYLKDAFDCREYFEFIYTANLANDTVVKSSRKEGEASRE